MSQTTTSSPKPFTWTHAGMTWDFTLIETIDLTDVSGLVYRLVRGGENTLHEGQFFTQRRRNYPGYQWSNPNYLRTKNEQEAREQFAAIAAQPTRDLRK